MSKFRCAVISIFPEMFSALTSFGVVGRAFKHGLLELILINPRDYAAGARRRVDARPYGGGPGMVMMAEPLSQAIEAAKMILGPEARVVYLSPQGGRFNQKKAETVLAYQSLILICGRYEGVDQRLLDRMVDEAISLGDFVVSGGELPAMMLLDAVSRLIPGVLGDPQSLVQESFQGEAESDYPVYTEPRIWHEQAIPEVLLSGHHEKIKEWREMQITGKK
ncbi:MAG: tRNA (guanosine(37)-N1)-methyltransferase TrmD [Gammaproteobacteria bacterium]|jgi:tRNA (guanine37-N1)-methyltransferase|nr:tRNA (guanosine(37)-N1)-methyltransferase TrmD [Gammaproteobacteria bacterium]